MTDDLKATNPLSDPNRVNVAVGERMTVNKDIGPADPMAPPSNRGHDTIGTTVEQRQRQMQGLGDLAEASQADDITRPRSEGYSSYADVARDPRSSEQMMADLARMTSEGKSGF